MTTRRQLALKLGGRHLVRMLLRRYPTRFRPSRETLQQVEQQRLAELESEFLNAEVPRWMLVDPTELTDDEKAFIRDRFYVHVNMTAPMLRAWTYDPRLHDGLNPYRKGWEARATRLRLRQLSHLRITGRPDGMGWSTADYNAARPCIFVVESLLHPHYIDYRTWVVLRNFGRDWAYPTRQQPRRRLPRDVELEAQLALERYEITGTPSPGL